MSTFMKDPLLIFIQVTEAGPSAFANIHENYYYVFVVCSAFFLVIAYFFFPYVKMIPFGPRHPRHQTS